MKAKVFLLRCFGILFLRDPAKDKWYIVVKKPHETSKKDMTLPGCMITDPTNPEWRFME